MTRPGGDRWKPRITLREAMALLVGAAVVLALIRFQGTRWTAEDWFDFALRFLAITPIVAILVVLWARSNDPGAESERPGGGPGSHGPG